jgi:hypothetical protein
VRRLAAFKLFSVAAVEVAGLVSISLRAGVMTRTGAAWLSGLERAWLLKGRDGIDCATLMFLEILQRLLDAIVVCEVEGPATWVALVASVEQRIVRRVWRRRLVPLEAGLHYQY